MATRSRTTAWELADRHHDQATRRSAKPTRQPRWKDHYVKLVYFIYMSRYATADQVQARFPKLFNCDRTVRRHLKELVDQHYLGKVDVKSTGANWPHVFFCTPKGTQLLRDKLNLALKNAREEGKSLQSIEHELFLTEFDLACLKTIATTPTLNLLYHERRYMQQDKRLKYHPPPSNPGQPAQEQPLVPDAGFLLQVTRANQPPALLHYFVELDNGTEINQVVLAKFKKYLYWATSQGGQNYLNNLYRKHGSQNPKPTFRLLIIARRRGLTGNDQHRLADLYAQTLDVAIPQGLRYRMYFTTVNTLKQHQTDTPPLKAKMWLYPRDADPWIEDYRILIQSLNNQTSHQTYRQKREYVLQQLARQPRHAIFPIP